MLELVLGWRMYTTGVGPSSIGRGVTQYKFVSKFETQFTGRKHALTPCFYIISKKYIKNEIYSMVEEVAVSDAFGCNLHGNRAAFAHFFA